MKKTAILALLLIAVLAFAFYSYWPALSSFFIEPPQPGAVITAPIMVSPDLSLLTSTTVPPAKRVVERLGKIITDKKSEKEKNHQLVDPFDLRVAVRRKVPETGIPLLGKPKEPPRPQEIRLEGIWIDAGMKVAFISSQALQVGEKIRGWTVSSILKDRVLLEKGSQIKILRMEEK
jgi:hypothetical protein